MLLHYHRFGQLPNWPGQHQAAWDQTRAIPGPALFSDLQALYGAEWSASRVQSDPDLA